MTQSHEKKDEKSLKDAKMPPLPFAHQMQEVNVEPKKKSETISEAVEKIKEMQKFCDEVEKQLEEVYRLTGWSPQFLEAFFQNANNFSLDEWERINKERKDFMASIMTPQDLAKEEEKAKKVA
jgi:hypothetical protein